MKSVLDGIQIIDDDDEDNINGTMMDIVDVLVARCWCMRQLRMVWCVHVMEAVVVKMMIENTINANKILVRVKSSR